MKRLFAVSTMLVMLFPSICLADGYLMVNYGIAGKIDDPSLGIELGGIFLSDLHPNKGALSIGLQVSAADTDEDPPSGNQPPSGLSYDPLVRYDDGYEQEIGVVLGAEVITSLFAVVGLGYSTQDRVTIGTSGGQNYEVDDETKEYTTFSLGLRYVIEGLDIGLGFHSRRGITAGVGIAF